MTNTEQLMPENGKDLSKTLIITAYGHTFTVPRKDFYTSDDIRGVTGADIQTVRRLLRLEKVPKSPESKKFALNEKQFTEIATAAFGSINKDVILPNGKTVRFKMKDEKGLILEKLLNAYQNRKNISYEVITDIAHIPRARFNQHIIRLRGILKKNNYLIAGPDRNDCYSFL